MKKIKYSLLGLAVLSLSFGGCKKNFLDTNPYNTLASSTMWQSEALCEQGMAGVYATLRGWGPSVANSGGAGNYLFDIFGMTSQGNYDNNGGFFRAGVTASSAILSEQWVKFYKGVYRANDAIEGLSGAPISEESKGRMMAEAKFLRALFYLHINALYGGNGIGVPLYLENVNANEYTKGQTAEMDVWEQIIIDLTEAINEPNLPDNYVNKKDGKASKGAAYALRGKAYLYRAQSKGWQGQDGKSDFEAAAADFAKVGEMGYGIFAPTGTDADFKQLFKEPNESSNEMIFSVQYMEDATKSFGINRARIQGAFQMGGGDNAGSWTDMHIRPAIADLYEVKVDNNTSKAFNWDDFITGYNTTPAVQREVFFLRDIKDGGVDIHEKVTSVVNAKLNGAGLSSVKNLYLEEGNEDRIRAAYAKRDPRLRYSIICPYDTIKALDNNPPATNNEPEYVMRWPWAAAKAYTNGVGKDDLIPGILPDLTANSENLFYLHRKFAGEGHEFLYRLANPIDEPLIRYADVLLMWAEALVELDRLPEAQAKVKQVRDRVGMPTMAANFGDKVTARDYVRDERRRELVNEGINFFDEMRWRTLKETKFDKSEDGTQRAWGAASAAVKISWPGDFYYVWGVPKGEVDKNTNLTRTPGWIY
ncbi:RagB/SusD family nutrient uptake outer membrane protein [Sphingobacterium wenxiniae]|uniref:Starch-binding associating with outer membrane n=1 Tax=Sphingobacterium wenxiniae TaxID=683125 RepID=A0A1I6R4C1_9SPHI|nr:RagB/SusD family nutrient uptake outer membrane protein [Sphingobacterium wenxiniae]SFS59592.1 Starch-binding associating with outer membrane [Sphingobacterium wenxiniae]